MIRFFIFILISFSVYGNKVLTYDDFIEQAEQMVKINNAKMSIEPLQKAISMEPDNWRAYNSLGLVYMNMEKYDLAKEQLLMATKKRPNSTETFYYLGVAYARDKKVDYDKAASYFNKALGITPNHYGSMLNLAAVYRYKRNDKAAGDLYQKILSEHQDDFEANYQLALILSKNSDKSEAIKYMEKAQNIKPDDLGIAKKLSELKSKSKNKSAGE